MKALLTSVVVLMIGNATLSNNGRISATKSESNPRVKVSTAKLNEAKAFLSKANVRQNKVDLATADGGI